MATVIVPYGQTVNTTLGRVLYFGEVFFLGRGPISFENLSGLSRRFMMGKGQKAEVHYFQEYEGYEGPVAVLFISDIIGRG